MEPKIGIIGCGSISKFHFNALEKIGAEVVHVSDINDAAGIPFAKHFNARFSRDYEKLIDDPEVTAVFVLTNSKYHKDICLAALQGKKDIICEKTMMDNSKEAEFIAKAVRDSDILFFTAYMKRFFPAAKKLKELLPSLGRLFSAQVRSYQAWGNLYEINDAKDFDWILTGYGGGVIKCSGSHMIDLTLSFLGRPESLYANVDYVSDSKLDRKAVALLEYPNGMTVHLETASHPLKKIGFERNSWEEHIQINGVNGRIDFYPVMWNEPENNAALLIHYDNNNETSTEYRFDRVNPFDVEVEYFCNCLRKREQGHPDVIDGFNVDVIIQSMIESGKSKSPVTLDWKGL